MYITLIRFVILRLKYIYLGQSPSIKVSKLRRKYWNKTLLHSPRYLQWPVSFTFAFWVSLWPQISSYNCFQCLHVAAFSPSPGFNHCFLLTGLNYMAESCTISRKVTLNFNVSVHASVKWPWSYEFFPRIANFITAIINKKLNLNTQNSRW